MANNIKKIFIVFSGLLIFISCWSSVIPYELNGYWKITRTTTKGFPWWHQVKYPTTLTLTKNEGYMIDQFNFECELTKLKYDTKSNEVSFQHCGKKKFEGNLDIIQLVKILNNGELDGKTIRGEEILIRWKGIKETRSRKQQ